MISLKLARPSEPESVTVLTLHPRPTPTNIGGREELFGLVPIPVEESIDKL